MRALFISKFGGPEVLEVRELPDPEPGPGEVRVRVEATGLNFAEVMARKGLYPDAPKPPSIVGYEGAGVIDALGPGVTAPAVGTRVIYLVRFGAFAEAVCAPADQVVPMPDAMSFAEGAAIPVNYITAYHMLFRVAPLRPGAHVLVHMAAGGVGTAALQLCRTVPRVVTYGTASAAKHDYVREQGCDHPIDYRSLDYAAEIRRLTNDRGVDIVLDALGGPDWKKGYELLAPAGMLVAFGMANVNTGSGKRNLFRAITQLMRVPKFSARRLMDENRGVAGVHIGHLWSELDLLRSELVALMKLYDEGAIRPHVDAEIPFDRAAEAHQLLELGKNRGKVILTPR
jgi:NADPH:quinone reductase-like Zn-dependent oxidoreductase